MKIIFFILIVTLFLFAAVDINSASQKELMSLKRVGAKKSKSYY